MNETMKLEKTHSGSAPLKNFEENLKYYFSSVFKKPLARPQWIYISLSHKCNLDCQMCGNKRTLRRHKLDFMLLKKVLAEIAQWQTDPCVVFTGGEPFLRRDIFSIIDGAVSLGLKTEVVTNGTLIDSAHMIEKIVASGLKNIAVSLDGAVAETHDAIRGVGGTYQKAVGALRALSQEKKKKGSGPDISVWMTIMKENLEELCDMMTLAQELEIDHLVYHPVIVAQADMQNTISTGSFWVRKDKVNLLKVQIERIAAAQKNDERIAFLHDPMLWLDYFQGTLTREIWKCNPFVFIDIGPDGNVRSCGSSFGNVRDMSLNDCLSSAQAQKARDKMLRCAKPCLQTCWARPEADSLSAIVENFTCQIESLPLSDLEKREILEKGLKMLKPYESMIERKPSHP